MRITQEMKDKALKVYNNGRPYCDGLPTDDPDYDFLCHDEQRHDPSPWKLHALKFWNGRYICKYCQEKYLAEDLKNAPTLEEVCAIIDREDPVSLMSREQKRWHDNLHIFIRQ